MNFGQRQRDPTKHFVGIAAVILFHGFVIYALMTGSRKVIEVVPPSRPRSSRSGQSRLRRPNRAAAAAKLRPRRRLHPAARGADRDAAAASAHHHRCDTPPPPAPVVIAPGAAGGSRSAPAARLRRPSSSPPVWSARLPEKGERPAIRATPAAPA